MTGLSRQVLLYMFFAQANCLQVPTALVGVPVLLSVKMYWVAGPIPSSLTTISPTRIKTDIAMADITLTLRKKSHWEG